MVTQKTRSTRQDMEKDSEKPEKLGPLVLQKEKEEQELEEEITTFAYGLKFLGTSGPKEYLSLQPEIKEVVGKLNYIKGGGTYSNIPQYGQVQYASLWKGIDIDFYEAQGHLKYDFIVHPGADPSQVQFEMNGVSDIKINWWSGELEFTTPLGELKKGIPYTYQMINDEEVKVSAKYVIKNGIISFKLGKYDKDYPLIIDPIALKFSTFLGGSADDHVRSIYVHPTSGKIYLAGYTNSTRFDGVSGVAVNNSSRSDGFVTCMSADGSTILWTTIIGGDSHEDFLSYVYVSDDENDVFVSGVSFSTDYPVNGLLAPYSSVLVGSRNQVISRISGDGTVLKYSTYFPVSANVRERFVVVDDIVYGGNYYNNDRHDEYPVSVPDGAYISTPPSEFGHAGMLLYGINTSLSGAASYQYGTYYYDETPDAYSLVEVSRVRAGSTGDIYFGGYFDIGASWFGPTDALFTPDAIHKVTDIQNTLGEDGEFSPIGYVAQFDPTLSKLIYATPVAPILDTDGICRIGQYNLINFDLSDNDDIYFTSTDHFYDVASLDDLVIGPNSSYTNLQPLEIGSNDDLVFNTASKISAADRSQYEYITTVSGVGHTDLYTPGGVIDKKDRLHWVYCYRYNRYGSEVDALSTSGALQTDALQTGLHTQYVILSPTGQMEYATIIGPDVDFGFEMDSDVTTSFITDSCTMYIGGFVRYNGQKTFPVTPSYWDADAGQQVFVHDATPATHIESWVTVFHEPEPSDNVINDFALGNNEFCADGLIYQEPNFGPILGDSIGYESGDGSIADHNLPDFRPLDFTESHPIPIVTEGYQWQISYDSGVTWIDAPANGNLPIYKPEQEGTEGIVQYRRAFFYDCCSAEPLYSNVATANIVGSLLLEAQVPTDPIYFCSGNVEDFTFPIVGAVGNISWQWYNGFAQVDNTEINPASGSGVPPASFTATIPTGVSEGGFYRLVVTDDSGCAVEKGITTIPLTSPAGTGPTMSICPGSVDGVTIGPPTPNPDFEFSWTGPDGFTSNDPNPVVSLIGTYNLQVKLVGAADFCVGGETTVDIQPLDVHDPLLVTIPDAVFCQGDAPAGIGITGDAPEGYVFQWSPGVNLFDATAFNPIFDPGSLTFGSPESVIPYTFTALRLSDGCVFETTMTVTNTALAFANAGDDGHICDSGFIGKASTTGIFHEWEAITTTFPGDLAALTADPAFTMDGIPGNLGMNKFLYAGVPLLNDGNTCYTIEYELRSSFIPLLNDCMARDTVSMQVCCGIAIGCPEINVTQVGSDGACGVSDNIISFSSVRGFTYVWTTQSVDGVIQPNGTEPRGLFETTANGGAALSSNGPHSVMVSSNFDDPTWGWSGANVVVYEVTGTGVVDGQVVTCSDQIQIFSGSNSTPVVDVVDVVDVCTAIDPGTILVNNGITLPYQISGVDYMQAPNIGLNWEWQELGGGMESIIADGNTAYPTLAPSGSQSYLVIASDPLSGCEAVDTFSINAVGILADAGDDITGLCSGALVQLGAPGEVGYSYEWSPSSGLNFPIGTPNNMVAQPYLVVPSGVAVDFSLIVTNLETGCQVTDTISITPFLGPIVPPVGNNYNSCANGEVFIGETYTPSEGIEFIWTASAGADISWLSSTSINEPLVTLPDDFTGPATFTLSVTNGTCGSASANYTITNDPADVDLGVDVIAVCVPPYIEIGSTTATPGYAYLWTPTEGLYTDAAGTTPYTGSNGVTNNIMYVLPLDTTEYTLIATNSTTGCLFTDTIVVDPPPLVDLDAGDDVSLCPGESEVTIGLNGGGTTTWTATGYSSSPVGTPATPTAGEVTTMEGYLSALSGATVDFSQPSTTPGIYVYTITSDYGGGCVVSDEVEVIVPDLPESLAGGSTVLCEGESVQIGTTGVAGVSYNWTILNETALSGTISDPNSATPTIDPLETTSYSLTFLEPVSGCMKTEVITAVVLEAPSITGGIIGPFCSSVAPQDLTAEVSGYAGLSNAIWYQNFVGGPLETTPTAVMPSQTTDYYLVGFSVNGCSSEAIVTIEVENPVTPDVLPETTAECPTETVDLVDFQGNPSDPTNTLEWHTDFTTNPATLISNTVVGPGTYYIFESSPNGCFSLGDSLIILEPECIVPLGSIGDYVWEDLNADGVQDGAEDPIEGVMVVLYDDMGMPLDTAYTDVNGLYLFDELPAGDYSVGIDPSNYDPGNPLEGYGQTFDADGGLDDNSDYNLGIGEDNLDQDFGYVPLGSIGDYVWEDLNADGVQDGAEDPIEGVMVVLYDDMGMPLDTAYTDVNGLYLFDELPAGDYSVGIDPSNYDPGNPLEGYGQTFDADGGLDDNSDYNLGIGEDNLTQDFGYVPLGSIGDYVWEDLNADGVQDGAEDPIEGVMVVLYDDLGMPLDTAYTDVNGLYLFDELPAGDYSVGIDPSNYDPGNPLEGYGQTFDADGGLDDNSDYNLGIAENNLTQDFGYVPLGSIGDMIVNDDTNTPIEGVMVVLYDDMGMPLDTAYTDVKRIVFI